MSYRQVRRAGLLPAALRTGSVGDAHGGQKGMQTDPLATVCMPLLSSSNISEDVLFRRSESELSGDCDECVRGPGSGQFATWRPTSGTRRVPACAARVARA